MTILRRTVGVAVITLSALGALLCLGSAAGVWNVKRSVDRVAGAAFGAADDAFEFMHTRLVLVQQRLDSTREQLDGLAARAQRLQTMREEAQAEAAGETESMRFTLDTLARELSAAGGWLDSIEAVARGVQSAAQSIAQSQIEQHAAATTSATTTAQETAADLPGVTAATVAHLAGDLADAVSRLEALRSRLQEVRENRLVAREFAAMVIAEAAELDTRLANLSARVDEFDMQVSNRRTASTTLGQRVDRWITLATAAFSLALIWFAISQVCMLRHAWQSLQR